MKIVSLSDFHGDLLINDFIPECDVVCICGDFSPLGIQCSIAMNGAMAGWIRNEFIPWLEGLPCKKVIVIAGNHDFVTEPDWFPVWFSSNTSDKIVYLANESYTYNDINFYGCPYSDIPGWAWSAAGNPSLYTIPENTDVVLVHQAPNWGDLGLTFNHWKGWNNYGSISLLSRVDDAMPRLLLCGHIHNGNHNDICYETRGKECVMVNCSIKDEDYELWYAPQEIIIDKDTVRVLPWALLNNETFTK